MEKTVLVKGGFVRCLGLLLAFLLPLAFQGCSTTEIRQEFFGLNVHDVVSSDHHYVRGYEIERDKLFDLAISTLKKMQAEILKKDRKDYLITAIGFDILFKSCINTTEVGIVIRPAGENKSEVVVYCGNYSLGKYVSDELYSRINAAPAACP
jgi:hypothetical protein